MIEHDLGGAMPRKVSDERKRFWRDLLERQPTSGLNIARFCADAGVSQNAFYVWKKRLLTTAQQEPRQAPPSDRSAMTATDYYQMRQSMAVGAA
jgi:transposase-like protein